MKAAGQTAHTGIRRIGTGIHGDRTAIVGIRNGHSAHGCGIPQQTSDAGGLPDHMCGNLSEIGTVLKGQISLSARIGEYADHTAQLHRLVGFVHIYPGFVITAGDSVSLGALGDLRGNGADVGYPRVIGADGLRFGSFHRYIGKQPAFNANVPDGCARNCPEQTDLILPIHRPGDDVADFVICAVKSSSERVIRTPDRRPRGSGLNTGKIGHTIHGQLLVGTAEIHVRRQHHMRI